MARERIRPEIDLSTMPDLDRLAEEVARTGEARILSKRGRPVAILSPTRRSRGRKVMTREAYEQALASTFGAWKELVDPDEFKRQRRDLQVQDADPRLL